MYCYSLHALRIFINRSQTSLVRKLQYLYYHYFIKYLIFRYNACECLHEVLYFITFSPLYLFDSNSFVYLNIENMISWNNKMYELFLKNSGKKNHIVFSVNLVLTGEVLLSYWGQGILKTCTACRLTTLGFKSAFPNGRSQNWCEKRAVMEKRKTL